MAQTAIRIRGTEAFQRGEGQRGGSKPIAVGDHIRGRVPARINTTGRPALNGGPLGQPGLRDRPPFPVSDPVRFQGSSCAQWRAQFNHFIPLDATFFLVGKSVGGTAGVSGVGGAGWWKPSGNGRAVIGRGAGAQLVNLPSFTVNNRAVNYTSTKFHL
jgi:hypothetical protein